ncbi:hypothetical protein [Thermomonospora umbrina]|uniref:Uncharacterized protein n=1 Tax=Thermomonospora umbrina TaxID=111806 RepID=A0A3D9SMC8_9ACTN|nr:hypothetical protein [Thermomonospora umbrina]REE96887.1 hypothetical protein DFJ69_2340 [Thermomonospora umbrina]
MVTVTMEWALWSERPAAGNDYDVLSCSTGRLRAGHFKKIITRFSPGTAEADWLLPRVTISTLDVARRPCVGVAVQSGSRQHDATGRRIAPTRFFLFPYEPLVGNPVSYEGLYRALADIVLPDADGPPLDVEVPHLDAAAIAASLRETGRDTVIAAASWLFAQRRVCVTRAENASAMDRLRFLDAAVSLLPYGHRSKITATTWAGSAARHNLRLYFARRAGGAEVQEVPWQEAVAVPATPYTRLLRRLLEDDRTAEELIAALAAETAARGLDESEAAFETLQRIGDGLHQDRALADDDHSLDDLRDWLDRDDLPAGRAARMLRKLVPQAQGKDVDRIARRLRQIDEGELRAWWHLIPPMAERLLWGEGARLGGLLQSLPNQQYTDVLVADLIRARPPGLREYSAGLNPMAQLLSEHVLGDPLRHPESRQALSEDVPVALALLYTIVADEEGGRTEDVVWACDRLPAELSTTMSRVLTGRADVPVEVAEILALERFGDDSVLTALAIAGVGHRLPMMAEAFVRWLIGRGGIRTGEESRWGNGLTALETDDVGMKAMIDVVLLTNGHQPRWIMDVPHDDWAGYQDGFAWYWTRDWPERNRMILSLAHYLSARSWGPETRGRADQVLKLTNELALPDRRSVDKALVDSLSQARDLSGDEYARLWLENKGVRYVQHPVKEHEPVPAPVSTPDATQILPVPSAGGISPSATWSPVQRNVTDSVLEFIAVAQRKGWTPEDAFAWLGRHKAITQSLTACQVFDRIIPALNHHVSFNEASRWAELFLQHVCEGVLGTELAQGFAERHLAEIQDRMRDDIQRIAALHHYSGILESKDRAREVKAVADNLKALLDRERGPRVKKPRLIWTKGSKEPGKPAPATDQTPGPDIAEDPAR